LLEEEIEARKPGDRTGEESDKIAFTYSRIACNGLDELFVAFVGLDLFTMM